MNNAILNMMRGYTKTSIDPTELSEDDTSEVSDRKILNVDKRYSIMPERRQTIVFNSQDSLKLQMQMSKVKIEALNH